MLLSLNSDAPLYVTMKAPSASCIFIPYKMALDSKFVLIYILNTERAALNFFEI